MNSSLVVPLVLANVQEWREWLLCHEAQLDGIWLALAKKGVAAPTSLVYQEALEEALCSGWIDGQRKSWDASVFLQRFTPRRSGSVWSKRNVEIVDTLQEQGRMRERGLAEVNRAELDGRWQRAYAGAATVQIPAELNEALLRNPVAAQAFAGLSKAERYMVLHPIISSADGDVMARRIAALITKLGV